MPVVTANKTLLARHGDELFDAAATARVPLLYEASVIAGVPFLGTFRGRPLASSVTRIAAVVNGTSNYILTRMAAARTAFAAALAEAQHHGYAEPDPAKDINGDDAVEKLCVLLRHFGDWSIAPAAIETQGITGLEPEDLEQAAAFGGRIRPVAAADWTGDTVTAFAGPAFLPIAHPLASLTGVGNGVVLTSRWSGDLFFSGPGAGPEVTAATVLDDVAQAVEAVPVINRPRRPVGGCRAPETGWFIRVSAPRLAHEHAATASLGSLGVRIHRYSPIATAHGAARQWMLTAGCSREHVETALEMLRSRLACTALVVRALD